MTDYFIIVYNYLKEYPKSRLKDFEFDYMNIVILEEEAKTPGHRII